MIPAFPPGVSIDIQSNELQVGGDQEGGKQNSRAGSGRVGPREVQGMCRGGHFGAKAGPGGDKYSRLVACFTILVHQVPVTVGAVVGEGIAKYCHIWQRHSA
jgi:hypothetical protein